MEADGSSEVMGMNILVAGVDVGVREQIARAAVVVLRYPDLEILEKPVAEAP